VRAKFLLFLVITDFRLRRVVRGSLDLIVYPLNSHVRFWRSWLGILINLRMSIMSRKSRRVRQLLGYGSVALAIVGMSFGCAFYFKGREVKCEYLSDLREGLLKVERDELILIDVQVLLQSIRSSKGGVGWPLEYESVVAELQGFVDDAYINVHERRKMIEARVQGVLVRNFCE